MRTNLQLLAAFMCGGLGGSVFTWYVNRPNPTIMTYSVTTTSLEANQAVRGLIPNLKIQIGAEEVPVIHTHTVEIAAQQGQFLDKAEIAVTFPSTVRFFGKVLSESPSPLQHIECVQVNTGANCSLFPVAPGKGSFRITMATDQRQPPAAGMVAKNADLIGADVFLKNKHQLFGLDLPQSNQDIFITLFSLVSMVVMGSFFWKIISVSKNLDKAYMERATIEKTMLSVAEINDRHVS